MSRIADVTPTLPMPTASGKPVEVPSPSEEEPQGELTYVRVPPRRSFNFLARCTSLERGQPMPHPDPLEGESQ